MRSGNRRGPLWEVKSRIHRRFIWSLALSGGLVFLISSLALFAWFYFVARRYVDLAPLISPIFALQIRESIKWGVAVWIVINLLVQSSLVLMAVALSRRVIGPVLGAISRIEKYLGGDDASVGSFTLRDGDYFSEFTAALNELVDRLQKRE